MKERGLTDTLGPDDGTRTRKIFCLEGRRDNQLRYIWIYGVFDGIRTHT